MNPTSSQSVSLPPRLRELAKVGSVVDAFRLAADGCDVLFVEAPSGTELPPHTHDSDNYSVVLSGRVVMIADGETHRYGPGEWCHTPAGAEHAVRFDVDTVQLELRFLAR
jgi:quercetin dioxygenase-like cupin family protein